MKLLFLFILTLNGLEIIAQNVLQGKVKDCEANEPMIFANIALYQNGNFIMGTKADFEGFYSMTEIDPGEYQVLFQSTGYNEYLIHGIRIITGNSYQLDWKLCPGLGLEHIDIFLPPAPQVYQPFGQMAGNIFIPNELSKIPIR